MKALSLRQPWAWLVVHGGKLIENRRWYTRHRGPFLVHAAAAMTSLEYVEAVGFARKADPRVVVPPRDELEFGGIIGRARVIDVVPPCELVRDDPFDTEVTHCNRPWHIHNQHGFVLADVSPLVFFPWRGSLNFFNIPDEKLPPAYVRAA